MNRQIEHLQDITKQIKSNLISAMMDNEYDPHASVESLCACVDHLIHAITLLGDMYDKDTT